MKINATSFYKNKGCLESARKVTLEINKNSPIDRQVYQAKVLAALASIWADGGKLVTYDLAGNVTGEYEVVR